MTAPVLVPCLATLRAEVNRLAPGRDKGADGWIGDTAHQAGQSDHNDDETGNVPFHDADSIHEVHALDIDSTGPWPPGRSLDDCVEIIRLRQLRGEDERLEYIIWRARIASRSHGWTWRTYAGASAHFDHAHFSARYLTAQEGDTKPWGLLAAPAPAQEDDMSWDDDVITNPAWRADAKTNPTVKAKFALGAAWNEAHTVSVKLDQVLGQLKALTGKDFTDEAAIVAGVLTGLSPQAIAAAIPQAIARQVAGELAKRLQS